jgi:hypothetical protein
MNKTIRFKKPAHFFLVLALYLALLFLGTLWLQHVYQMVQKVLMERLKWKR